MTRRPGGWCPPPTTTIELTPIDDRFAEELLLRELPARAASDAVLSRLRSAAAGNPLYLIELARSVASGASASTTVFPETVERVLAARIDQLPVVGRELIRDVAVLGSTTSRALASRVLERPDLVDAGTWRVELGDLMVIDEDTVRFRHDLVGRCRGRSGLVGSSPAGIAPTCRRRDRGLGRLGALARPVAASGVPCHRIGYPDRDHPLDAWRPPKPRWARARWRSPNRC